MENDRGIACEEKSHYIILIKGHLNSSWSKWFDGMTIEHIQGHQEDELTKLSGVQLDQAALRGFLNKIWDLNLSLVLVHPEGWILTSKGV